MDIGHLVLLARRSYEATSKAEIKSAACATERESYVASNRIGRVLTTGVGDRMSYGLRLAQSDSFILKNTDNRGGVKCLSELLIEY